MPQTQEQIDSAVSGLFYRQIDGSVWILKSLLGFKEGRANLYLMENLKTKDSFKFDPYDFKYSFRRVPNEELKALEVLYGN